MKNKHKNIKYRAKSNISSLKKGIFELENEIIIKEEIREKASINMKII